MTWQCTTCFSTIYLCTGCLEKHRLTLLVGHKIVLCAADRCPTNAILAADQSTTSWLPCWQNWPTTYTADCQNWCCCRRWWWFWRRRMQSSAELELGGQNHYYYYHQAASDQNLRLELKFLELLHGNRFFQAARFGSNVWTAVVVVIQGVLTVRRGGNLLFSDTHMIVENQCHDPYELLSVVGIIT